MWRLGIRWCGKLSVKKLTEVVKFLEKEGKASPNKIATEVGSDRRTVKNVLSEGMKLKIIKCETLEVGGRKYSVCSLTPEYQKMTKTKHSS